MYLFRPTLIFPGGPNITYSLNEATGVQGQTISLPCRVKGYPLPKIIWTKNGQPLLDQRKVVASNGTLNIKNLQRNDKGWYVCTAVNTKGNKGSVAVMVKVLGKNLINIFHLNTGLRKIIISLYYYQYDRYGFRLG